VIQVVNRNRAPELPFYSAQYVDEEATLNLDFDDVTTTTDVDADGDAVFYTCEYKYKDAEYVDLTAGEISTIQVLRNLMDTATNENDYNNYYANLIAYTSNFIQSTAEVWYDCTSIFQEPIDGMSFNAASGILSWTPNKNAQHEDRLYKIRITATDGSSSDSQEYSLYVNNINTPVEITEFDDLTTYSLSDVIYTYEDEPIEPIRFNAKINLSAAAGASTTYSCYFDTEEDGIVENVLPCSLIGITFDTDLDRFSYDGSVSSPSEFYEIKLIRSSEEAVYGISELEHIEQIDDDGERVRFTCVYDNLIDGSVTSTSLCSEIGVNLDTNTGLFNFVASEVSSDTDFEFKITISDNFQSFDSTIFAVTVRDKPKLRFEQVAFGDNHTCALSSAGEIYCWGDNSAGQLGVGDTFDRRFPLKIELDVDNPIRFRKIKSHANQNCALSYGGDLYCWGENDSGQLGLGDNANKSLPVKVDLPIGITPDTIVDFALGDDHSCIVNGKGRVYCVGDNTYGQLGVGPTSASNEFSSTNVSFNLFTYKNIYRIEAGDNHTCALSGSGALYCWGRNDQGQIGDGTTTDVDTVSQVDDDVYDFDTGDEHTCYIDDALDVYCFGKNDNGQLGDATATDRSSPTAIFSGASASKIRAGSEHTCYISDDPSVEIECFGEGTEGQLGDGTASSDSQGVSATGTDGISALFVGANSNCILQNSGLLCWGDNENYQFLDGATTDYDSPTSVALDALGYEDDDIVAVHIGSRVCYTHSNGKAYCTNLGLDIDSDLDDEFKLFSPVNESIFKEIYEYVTPAGSSGVASYITYDNRVLSYGGNSDSYWDGSGSGFKAFTDTPTENAFLGDNVAISSEHICYLGNGLTWTCSGNNDNGEFGNFPIGSPPFPAGYNDNSAGGPYKKIVAGVDHTCALNLSGGISCSGLGRAIGQGTGANSIFPLPIDISDFVNLKFINLFAGDGNTCAISDKNELYCFGDLFTDDNVVHVDNPSDTYWRSVEISSTHICAISIKGETYCMGENSEGQLGDGTGSDKTVLQNITSTRGHLDKFKEIGLNADTTCGITVGGELYCWGKNTAEEMGFDKLVEDQSYFTPQKYEKD
jgi:alpha-tubulin suppressor-like RCC1 family protein